MKNKNELISKVTAMEGKKIQVSRAQVIEILNIVGTLIMENPKVIWLLIKDK